MEKASTESGFNPAAKSKTSSASGLFQFIDSTWLKMVKEHGAKFGLGALADKIQIRDGKPRIDDDATRKTILNLRQNPEISALMAGAFSADNKAYLEKHTEGSVGKTELYLAHFLGAAGAAKLLHKRDDNGNAAASDLFPKEARANKNVFFDEANGQPRTLDALYDFFAQKFAPETAARPPAPAAAAAPSFDTLFYAQEMATLLSSDTPYSENTERDSKSGFSHSRPIMAQINQYMRRHA